MSKVEIRHAHDADLPDFQALAAGHAAQADYCLLCMDEQEQGKRRVFIAFSGDRPAGYAMLNSFPQYAPFRRMGIPEIQDLYVLPEFRRQGIGAALIDFCEQKAKEEGCGQIGIGVGLHASYGPAQRLYIRLGYVPDGGGIVYDRQTVTAGDIRPVDDNLSLMMIKNTSHI